MSAVSVPGYAGDDAHVHAMDVRTFIRTYVFSLDHKIIGLQFLFSTLLWFLVGGLLALGIRWQLAMDNRCRRFGRHPEQLRCFGTIDNRQVSPLSSRGTRDLYELPE